MRTTLIVPTLGATPLLADCLRRLRQDGGSKAELVVVHQGPRQAEIPARVVDVVHRIPENRGFAAACNLGIAGSSSELVGLVNDDLWVEPGWLELLARALLSDKRLAAVQGTHEILDRPGIIDGCGIAWNFFWRPVQIGRGRREFGSAHSTREIFGASGTGVLYRRSALDAVSPADSWYFEPRLVSYYEDVELAIRLQRADWRALFVPAARARHAGSSTSRTMPRVRQCLHFSNRLLVAARMLGTQFWPRLPLMWVRDLAEMGQLIASRRFQEVSGALAGWRRALRLLPEFARSGKSQPSLEQLRRFRVTRASRWPWADHQHANQEE